MMTSYYDHSVYIPVHCFDQNMKLSSRSDPSEEEVFEECSSIQDSLEEVKGKLIKKQNTDKGLAS